MAGHIHLVGGQGIEVVEDGGSFGGGDILGQPAAGRNKCAHGHVVDMQVVVGIGGGRLTIECNLYGFTIISGKIY